ncbi:MAG: Hsp70 family protein [Deltaproteobacteria bacterium]|jgi:molecular chaperone DnaK|nr:Hsp70 family protein [Deltaproteobacteria bacterium]
MSEKIFGIDLGTTNSCISVLENNAARVIPIEGTGIVPSVVSLNGQEFLIGRKALNRAVAFPEESVRSVKRLMGTDKTIELGQKSLRPEEISSMILGYLKEEASRLEKIEVQRAVITVPAYFSDAQRRATIEAGELAGLKVERIVNEPTAAALFYDLVKVEGPQRPSSKNWKYALVYDLGGGTFDVSILKLGEIVEVIASTGDTELGGDDFDKLLSERLKDRILITHKVDLSGYPPAMARLRAAAEKAKIELSVKGSVMVEEALIPTPEKGKTVSVSMEVTRTELEIMAEPLLRLTMEYVSKALNEASLITSNIDRVIMVGGMTRMPIITKNLSDYFGYAQLPAVDPDLSVSYGAAIQGGLITGESAEQILVDVTAHTLSTESLSMEKSKGFTLLCVPIIPRNTPIPAVRSRVFYSINDRQKEAMVTVFQGESEIPKENTLIGKKILALAPAPEGSPIEIEFSYDLNGVVHVVAEQRGFSRRVELRVDSRSPDDFVQYNLSTQGQNNGDDDDDESEDAELDTKTEDQGIDLRVNLVVRRAQQLIEKLEPGPKRDQLEAMTLTYRKALVNENSDEGELDKLEEELLKVIDLSKQSVA